MHHSKGVNQLKVPSAFLFFNFPCDMRQILWEKKKEMKFLLFAFQNGALCIGKVLLGNVPSTYITNFLQVLYASIE
jgi:hypothetical protein